MNSELRKMQKVILKKNFFKLMNTAVFGKTMRENIETFVTTCNDRRKKELNGIKTKLSYNKKFFR